MPTRSGDWVGAFLVWFRLPHSANDRNGSQVTSEIAYDAAGHIIAGTACGADQDGIAAL